MIRKAFLSKIYNGDLLKLLELFLKGDKEKIIINQLLDRIKGQAFLMQTEEI